MLVKTGNDGTYSATWTPGSTGFYSIRITLDGYDVGKMIFHWEAPSREQPPAVYRHVINVPIHFNIKFHGNLLVVLTDSINQYRVFEVHFNPKSLVR